VLTTVKRRLVRNLIPSAHLTKRSSGDLAEISGLKQPVQELSKKHKGLRTRAVDCLIEEVRTTYPSPWQNPFVERFIGTLRREMLNHMIALGQGHLERLLREFIEEYYHVARPHQGLDGNTSVLQTKQPQILGPSKLISIPVIGVLHHRYIRVAA